MERKDTAPHATSPDFIENLQEEMLAGLDNLTEGAIVDGTIVQISDEEVFVDIGYKSEGKLSASEFADPIEIGQKLQVLLLKKEIRNGGVLVSYRKAQERIHWEEVKKAYQEQEPVQATVHRLLQNTFEVLIEGHVKAYVAYHKMDVQRIESPEDYVGKEYTFLIERLFRENKVNVLLSRRAWLEQENERKRAEFFREKKLGDVVEGTVKNFVSFGAFIDLGGFDGLLHLNEMSWGHSVKPKSYFKRGDHIELKIVQFDPELKKISLSLREMRPNPWLDFEDKFALNQIVDGVVTKLTDFGAFVSIEEGIEGLIHLSELSWARNVRDPHDILSVGQELEVAILDYDLSSQRISLSLKRTMHDPWDTVNEKYPVGTKMKRPIVKITKTGMFVEIDELFDAFIYSEHVSWTSKIRNLNEHFKVGEEVEFIITKVDPMNKRICAGIRELSEDPWVKFAESYPVGTVLEGTITRISEHGLIVKVPFDIEGLVHTSELHRKREEREQDALHDYEVGKTIRVLVKDINTKKYRIALSIRDVHTKEHAAQLQQFLHDETKDEKVSLGDYMK